MALIQLFLIIIIIKSDCTFGTLPTPHPLGLITSHFCLPPLPLKVGLKCVSPLLVLEKIYWLNYKDVSRTTTTYKVDHCVKNDEIRAFSNLYFPVFGLNWRFSFNTGKYGYDLSIYGKIRIRGSLYLGIYHPVGFFLTSVNA